MKCRKCGTDTALRGLCHTCGQEWLERVKAAFSQAIDELGPMTKENFRAIQTRKMALAKEMKNA